MLEGSLYLPHGLHSPPELPDRVGLLNEPKPEAVRASVLEGGPYLPPGLCRAPPPPPSASRPGRRSCSGRPARQRGAVFRLSVAANAVEYTRQYTCEAAGKEALSLDCM